MKRKKKTRFRFPESGESFQIIEAGPPVYYVTPPEKCTVVKPVPMGEWIVQVVPNGKKKSPKVKP